MIRKIITNPMLLKQTSTDVEYAESIDIIKDLEDTLKEQKYGIGLSAIQIGIPKRVSIIRYNDKKVDLINPIITERYDRIRVQKEGCLSFPGLYVDTARYKQITLFMKGKQYIYNLETDGLICIAIQHEIDHQNGTIYLQRKWQRGDR